MFNFLHKNRSDELRKLKRANKDLLTLVKVNKSIANLDDLDATLNEIFNGIEKSLGYRSSLLLVNESEQTLDAFNANHVASSFINFFTHKSKLSVPLEYKNPEDMGLAVKACKTGEIILSKSMFEIVKPLISESVANTIQKIMGITDGIVVPIKSKGKCIAVLTAGAKAEIEKDNIDTLSLYSELAGLAINNSNLYEKTQQQVIDLKDRNRQLEIINNFTEQIITTLDAGQVAQKALDNVTEILGYALGIYSFYDEDIKTLKVIAMTDNMFSKLLLPILPKKPTDYAANIDDPIFQDSINVMAFKEGKIFMTDHLNMFVKNLIPEHILDQIQRVLGIKTVAAIPLKNNNKVVGVLNFVITDQTPEEISQLELDTMNVIGNQISIAMNNAYLYEKTTQTLNTLQDVYAKNKDMLDILGHELRTPVTICKGNIEILMKGSSEKKITLDEYHEGKLEIAYESIKKESNLINELLSATKLDSGQLVILNEVVDIYKIAQNSYKTYLDIASKQNLKLTFEEPSMPIPETIGDSIRLGEVVDNLLSNAIKYTKEGFVKITMEVDEKNIFVHVEDTGNGIPKDEIPNLFQKFYRLHNYLDNNKVIVRPGGVGLGLYVSKGIVEAHGGKIWVESDGEGKGSIFSFSIPIKKYGDNDGKVVESDMFVKMGYNKDQ